MKGEQSSYRLHVFTLRVWREQIDGDVGEWLGEVKNTSTGEVRYFRNASSLHDALLELLDEPATPDGNIGASRHQ